MLFEDLERINSLLDSISEAKKDNEKDDKKEDKEDKENKVITPAKEDEIDKVDITKELTSTGSSKKDFSNDIVNAINDIINGEGTIEELIKIVKDKK